MIALFRQRQLLIRNFLPLIGICLCMYFTYHAVQGHRSVMQLAALNKSIADAEAREKSLQQEHANLERSVMMMRPGTLSRDMLEEQARRVLGYRHPDEMEIIRN